MRMAKSAAIDSFDDVFPHIGGFGPYQYIIFSFVCLIRCFYTILHLGQIFMSLTPPHSCALSPGFEHGIQQTFGVNLTGEQLKNLTIPRVENGDGHSKCLRYDITIDQIDNSLQPNISWPTTNCTYGWDYDYTIYYPSISSQLNWVCEEDWKPVLAQSISFVGSMIGIPMFGWLADTLGRIPVTVASNLIAGIFGMGSSFCNSFVLFCILRFIVGLTFDSNYQSIYILGMEFTSAPYRSILSNSANMIFLTGTMCIIPWAAYYIHDWTTFSIVFHSPFLICVILPWLVPESARWLLSKGKTEKALQIMEAAAKANKKELPEDFVTNFESYAKNVATNSPETVSWLDLLKTPILRKRFVCLSLMWVLVFVAYDGHIRFSENIGSNIFVSFSIMSAIEFPAGLVTIFSADWLGRRNTTVWSLLSAGLIVLLIMFVKEGETYKIVALGVAGRFLITVSINVTSQYVLEILPTVGRAQGAGVAHTIGLGMAFVSPYIVYLGKFQHWLPYLVLGLISCAGALFSLFLPETAGEKLPDTLTDGETFFKDQPFFYNPFEKKKEEERRK